MTFYVYILASQKNGTLYTGSTQDVEVRVWEHKNKVQEGFTAKYGVNKLVWYEGHATREGAFVRERQIKKWNRAWKIELIEAENPDWRDIWAEWFSEPDRDWSVWRPTKPGSPLSRG